MFEKKMKEIAGRIFFETETVKFPFGIKTLENFRFL